MSEALLIDNSGSRERIHLDRAFPVFHRPIRAEAVVSLAAADAILPCVHQIQEFKLDATLDDGTLVYCERAKRAEQCAVDWYYTSRSEAEADAAAELQLRRFLAKRGAVSYGDVLQDTVETLERPSRDNGFVGRKRRVVWAVTNEGEPS